MNRLRIELGTHGRTTVVAVAGELDVETAAEFGDAVTAASVESTVLTVVVDMAGVTFIDSTALGVLVTARNDAAKSGMTLRLRAVSERVMQLLKITGLDSVFAVEP